MTEEQKSTFRTPLCYHAWARGIAFFFAVLFAAAAGLSILAAVLCADENVYETDREQYDAFVLEGVFSDYCHSFFFDDPHERSENDLIRQAKACGFTSFRMEIPETETLLAIYEGKAEAGAKKLSCECSLPSNGEILPETFRDGEETQFAPPYYTVRITATVSPDSFVMRRYGEKVRLFDVLFYVRYLCLPVGAVSIVLFLILFVFLMRGAGHKPGTEELTESRWFRFPYDLLAALCVSAGILIVYAVGWYLEWVLPIEAELAAIGAVACVLAALALFLCLVLSARVKRGTLLKETVLYRFFLILLTVLAFLWKTLKKGSGLLVKGIRAIPLAWKPLLCLLAYTLIEVLLIIWTYTESTEVFFLLWLMMKLLLFPLALYLNVMLKRLYDGGKRLRAGDLDGGVDLNAMAGFLRKHGEDLNGIRDGVDAAVKQQMKSERLKTELITNVSHDIKTPLTSIISYTDLLSKEQTENERVKEYSEVILRQSEKLKRLLEDLVEASKASSGNVEMTLAPCGLGVLFTQAAGEYEQKLAEKDLTLVTTAPRMPVEIMADGQKLWRVLDNLLNNVFKYALGGTRVYFDLAADEKNAVLSLRNISREPLNVPPDELLERFTRGDASRNTEGNGLGLSIAQSLTSLMGGKLSLFIDGDLFKVVLEFPLLR